MQKSLRGFSLLELLIAMTLMLIIGAFLIYMWQNTMLTMQFARSAVTAHSQGRRVIRVINETLNNVSGNYPLLAGNVGPTGNLFCADIAGLDSFRFYNDGAGNSYGFARGIKWSNSHTDALGNTYYDHSRTLPDYINHPYTSVYATGIWTANHEVYINQTVVPTVAVDRSHLYRSVGSGKLSLRDVTNDSVTTGASEPTWPTEYGQTVEDGQVTWMCVPPYLHFVPINIPNSPYGRIPFDKIQGKINVNDDYPDTALFSSSATGLGVGTDLRISIFSSNISGLQIMTSATHYYDVVTNSYTSYAAGSLPTESNAESLGELGPVDEQDLDLYTGYRGIKPQGLGYRPRFASDTQAETSPLTPRWIRIDFSVTGEISPDIEEAALPVFTFTHMVMLR